MIVFCKINANNKFASRKRKMCQMTSTGTLMLCFFWVPEEYKFYFAINGSNVFAKTICFWTHAFVTYVTPIFRYVSSSHVTPPKYAGLLDRSNSYFHFYQQIIFLIKLVQASMT